MQQYYNFNLFELEKNFILFENKYLGIIMYYTTQLVLLNKFCDVFLQE